MCWKIIIRNCPVWSQPIASPFGEFPIWTLKTCSFQNWSEMLNANNWSQWLGLAGGTWEGKCSSWSLCSQELLPPASLSFLGDQCSDLPWVKLSVARTAGPAWEGRGLCGTQTFCTNLWGRHLNTRPSSFAKTWEERIQGMKHRVLNGSTQKWHLLSLLTFYRPEQVTWSCSTSGGWNGQCVRRRRGKPEILVNSRNVSHSEPSTSRYGVPISWANRVTNSPWFAQYFSTFSSESPMSP